MGKFIAEVNRNRCVACGACQKKCPKGAISIFKGCFAVIDAEKCVGCGLCAGSCPAGIIGRKEIGTEEAVV